MQILKMKGHTRTDSMHEVKSVHLHMYIYIHPHSTFYSTSGIQELISWISYRCKSEAPNLKKFEMTTWELYSSMRAKKKMQLMAHKKSR